MHYKFRYPELFDGVERPDFLKLSGNLVIYGAEFQGLLAAHLLKKQGVDILCFCDRKIEKQGTVYYGIPVISPEEMKKKYPDAAVVVTPYGVRSVIDYLRNELQYKNIITPFPLFLEFDSGDFDRLPELPAWYHPEALAYHVEMFLMKCLDVHTDLDFFAVAVSVTEKCSLRCRNCTSLMPCYENPQDFKFEDVFNDILNLIKGKKFHRILLEGGEPFLWKPFPRLLNALCQRDEIMNIIPITNGTIIPYGELLTALKNPKITVRISDYGSFTKTKELKKVFSENNINHMLVLQSWYELASFSRLPKSEREVKKNIDSCCKLQTKSALYEMDGKLFKCAIQANMHRLGLIKSKAEDYVDLREKDEEKLQEKIADYFTKPIVPEICRHCNGRGYTGIEVPPAEQVKKGEKLIVRFE